MGTTGVGGVNDGAYYVLSDPAGGVEIIRVFVTNTGGGTARGYEVSGEAGFTGGTATVEPTATDQGDVSTTRPANGFYNYTTDRGVAFGYAETVAPYRFLFITCADDSTRANHFERTRMLEHWAFTSRRRNIFVGDLDDQQLLNYFIHGSGNGYDQFAGTVNDWFIYEDPQPGPVTAGGFVEVDWTLKTGWGIGGTPWDNIGLVPTPFILRRLVATQRAIPPPSDLLWKNRFEAGGGGARNYAIPIEYGGLDDGNFLDFIAANNLCFFWDGVTPIWTDAVPLINRAYMPVTDAGPAEVPAIVAPAAIAGGLSDFLENDILETRFRSGAVYISLHTADPGEDGLTAEVPIGNGYAREIITFAAASGGIVENDLAITFAAVGGGWGTITHFGIWDAVSGGTHQIRGQLATSSTIGDGDEQRVELGSIFLTVG